MTQHPAKLLLFGEYTVTLGGAALAVPYTRYVARWRLAPGEQQLKREAVLAFSRFLQANAEKWPTALQLDRFEQDLSDGWILDTEVPVGYGLGSSGMLCAAIVQRYLPTVTTYKRAELQALFVEMEAFFHGRGSGFDPLISFYGEPLLRQNGQQEAVSLPPRLEGQLFLLDTQMARQTAPLVQHFQTQMEAPDFHHQVEQHWQPATTQAIQAFLRSDTARLVEAFLAISQQQYQLLPRMIPEALRLDWAYGLETEAYLLKLCGAGGGGFMLGYTRDWTATQRLLGQWPLLPLQLHQHSLA